MRTYPPSHPFDARADVTEYDPGDAIRLRTKLRPTGRFPAAARAAPPTVDQHGRALAAEFALRDALGEVGATRG